jgi:hypothetical protein
MKSASYDYRNKSVRRGEQLVSIGMPTVSRKAHPRTIAHMLSIKTWCMLRIKYAVSKYQESEKGYNMGWGYGV